MKFLISALILCVPLMLVGCETEPTYDDSAPQQVIPYGAKTFCNNHPNHPWCKKEA